MQAHRQSCLCLMVAVDFFACSECWHACVLTVASVSTNITANMCCSRCAPSSHGGGGSCSCLAWRGRVSIRPAKLGQAGCMLGMDECAQGSQGALRYLTCFGFLYSLFARLPPVCE